MTTATVPRHARALSVVPRPAPPVLPVAVVCFGLCERAAEWLRSGASPADVAAALREVAQFCEGKARQLEGRA